MSSWYTCVLVIHSCPRGTLVSSWYTRVHEVHSCPRDTLVSLEIVSLATELGGGGFHWLGALWRHRWLYSYLYVACFVSFHLSLVSPKQSRKALRCFPNSVLVGRSEKNNIETENVVEIRKPSYLDRILAKQHVRSFNAAVLRQEHNVSLLLAKRRKIILLNQNVKSLRIYITNYEDKVFLTERKKKRHGKKTIHGMEGAFLFAHSVISRCCYYHPREKSSNRLFALVDHVINSR